MEGIWTRYWEELKFRNPASLPGAAVGSDGVRGAFVEPKAELLALSGQVIAWDPNTVYIYFPMQ